MPIHYVLARPATLHNPWVSVVVWECCNFVALLAKYTEAECGSAWHIIRIEQYRVNASPYG